MLKVKTITIHDLLNFENRENTLVRFWS